MFQLVVTAQRLLRRRISFDLHGEADLAHGEQETGEFLAIRQQAGELSCWLVSPQEPRLWDKPWVLLLDGQNLYSTYSDDSETKSINNGLVSRK